MADNTRLYWIHALSPIHVGVGQGVGYIDLPIMRERVTNWPTIPGSSIKGVLADKHNATETNRRDMPLLRAAFGWVDPKNEQSSVAGALVFTDARLVCLPIRSFYGTFAWCTSAMALRRLVRDLLAASVPWSPRDIKDVADGVAAVSHGSPLAVEGKVYLEDLDFSVQEDDWAGGWAEDLAERVFPGDPQWQEMFNQRFAVLPDNVFNFLCETATEVTARVQLRDDTKTVGNGPWYEEALPAETILAGLVWCDRVRSASSAEEQVKPQDLLDAYCSKEEALQMGGKATVGKGRVRCVFQGSGGDRT